MTTSAAIFTGIVSDSDPRKVLAQNIEMDADGLQCALTSLRHDTQSHEYIRGILLPMAARFQDYVDALRFLEEHETEEE